MTQLEDMPSLLSILKGSLKIENQTLLKIIAAQVSGRKDILSVLRDGQFIEESLVEQALQQQVDKKTPLGKILVSKNVISAEELNEHLNNFLQVIEEAPEPEAATELEVKAASEPEESCPQSDSGDCMISSAALDSMREQVESGMLDASVLEELEAELKASAPASEVKAPAEEEVLEIDTSFIGKLSESLSAKFLVETSQEIKDLTTENVTPLFEKIHELKGVARLLNATLLETALDNFEKLLGSEQLGPTEEEKERLYKLFEFVNEVKVNLEMNKSEKEVKDNKAAMNKYNKLIKDVA